MQIMVPDIAAMDALGQRIASVLAGGDTISLSGDLGCGKTTLARAIICGLGYAGEVPSPSFAIVQYYDSPALALPVVHADFFRLENADELDELGLDERSDSSVLIAEWPERIGGLSGENCLAIAIGFAPQGGRVLTFEMSDKWIAKLPR